MGPQRIMDKMKAILSHIGAWAPKAEQVAVAKYLLNAAAVDVFLVYFKREIEARLDGFYRAFMELKKEGYGVDAIVPQAAIYLTVKLDLKGRKSKNGTVLHTQQDVTQYILENAKLALVPFSAFGAPDDSYWYRLSVGTCHTAEIPQVFSALREVLKNLN